MRTKVTKFIFGDIENISISRFICSEDSLLNIIGLFEYETSGMEAHHIIEKRLVKGSSWKVSKMPSIELTKAEHRVYINKWKDVVAYGTRYKPGLSYKYQLYKASNSVYRGNRVLKMASRYTIWKMR